MDYERFELFEAYTANTLPADQREQFEQEIANNATIRTELQEYQTFRHSIESVKLSRTLNTIHDRLERQGALTEAPPSPTVVRSRQRFRPSWAVAGLVVLLLAGISWYWWAMPSETDSAALAEQTFLAFYQPEPQARTQTTCARDLAPGLQAYRASNYQAALNAFEKLPAELACMPYYRGITHLALNNANEAVTELERALTHYPDVSDLTHQKAAWYLALAYLKAHRLADARNQLQKIGSQPNHPFRTVAEQALAALGRA